MEQQVGPVRLVCLPFAGAGASFYWPWSTLVDQRLRVTPLQLPGRERRIDEEPYRDVHRAVNGLVAELLEELTGGERLVLFGHSLGAVLAYELACRLATIPDVELVRLFVSGSPQPNRPRIRRATGLGDDEFLARVREFAGFRHEALEDPEMRELMLPSLRADVEMHESYRPSTDEPLPVPITSIRSEHDELVTADEAAAWAKVTSRDFEYVEVPGGHMYLTDSAAPLLRLIERFVH